MIIVLRLLYLVGMNGVYECKKEYSAVERLYRHVERAHRRRGSGAVGRGARAHSVRDVTPTQRGIHRTRNVPSPAISAIILLLRFIYLCSEVTSRFRLRADAGSANPTPV